MTLDGSSDLLASVLQTCDRRGEAAALTGPDGRTLSYATLGARIRATADALRSNGMRDADRVLFSVRPSPACVVLALGIVAAGGTVVFADPGAGPQLFAARFALAAPGWAAAESLLYAASRPLLRPLARRRGLLLPDYAGLPVRHIYAGRWLPGVPRRSLSADRLAARAGGSNYASPDGDTEALVVFTSGTTGAPRAVVHTRRSLGTALSVLAAACELHPGDVMHTDQLMLGLPALVAGAQWTMPPYGFRPAADPARYAAGLTGATHTFATPTDLSTVVDLLAADRLRLSSPPGHLLVGGAPVLAPLLRRARAALPGTEILAIYGMTEILPVAVIPAEEKIAYAGEGDPVGRPLPGINVRLGPDGELHLRGPHLCHGYLGEPPLTEHATGDLVRIDNDGRIVLLGRSKDMIIRGRTNIYPGLYEPTIATLPGVDTATLLGISDEIGDERVVLVLTPTDARDAGASEVLDRHPLAASVRMALPQLIDTSAMPDEVVVVSHLPRRGRANKPDRAALLTLLTGRPAP
jgi:acyl-CoA synthetase (AMP-forming)/AMP-acid ligase II